MFGTKYIPFANRTTKDEKETFYYIVMMILVDIKNQIKTHGDKSIDTNY